MFDSFGPLAVGFFMRINQYLDWKDTHTTRAGKAYRAPLERVKEVLGRAPRTPQDLVKLSRILSEKYDRNTVAYTFAVLKNYCGYLQANGERVINPFFVKGPRIERKQRPFMTEADYKRMMKVLSDWEFRDLTMKICIAILFQSGMRASELCGLTLADIDNHKNFTVIKTLKSKRFRYVMWSEEAHDMLCRYLGVRLCFDIKHDFLFVSGDKKPLTVRTLQRWFKEVCKRSGVEKNLTPHTARHGKAHAMRKKGADLLDIQHVLGHASPVSSEHYLRLDAHESYTAAKKFS